MRRIILLVVLLAFILSLAVPYGCTNKKPEQTDSVQSDSAVTDTAGEDSTENLISQTPMPKTADELFDDFVFLRPTAGCSSSASPSRCLCIATANWRRKSRRGIGAWSISSCARTTIR